MINLSKYRSWAAPLSCIGAALFIRLLALQAFRSSVLFKPLEGGAHDRSIYVEAITRAAQGIFWPQGAFEFLPLYPWLAGLFGSIFGLNLNAVAMFGITCDVVTTLLIYAFARRLGVRPAIATMAGLVYAAYPLAVIYSMMTMPNTLNALLVTAFAFSAHMMLERRDKSAPPAKLFGLGLFAGVITLGFAGMIMIAFAVLIILFMRTKSIPAAALFLLGTALPIVPLAIHNSKAEHQFVLLTTHGGFNRYMGNNERATGYPLRLFNFRMTARAMLEDAHRFAEKSAGRSLSKSESSAWWSEQAGKFWREHPGDAFLLTMKKVALFWNQQDMDDLRLLEQLRITDVFFRRLTGTPFAVIGLMGLIGLVFARGATVPRWTLLAGMTGLVIFFITARYRLTFTPLMLALGAAGTCRLIEEWRAGNKRSSLLLIPALALVCWPIYVRDQRQVDHYNTAIQLTAAGRVDEAMKVILRGLAIDPPFDQLYVAQGSIYFAQEKYELASEAYSTASILNPYNPHTSYNLALSLARAGNYCDARDALKEAQKLGLSLNDQMLGLLRELTAACEP